MKIIMRVEGQPGKEYHFPAPRESEDEATNILVGRDDVDCQAHWRLGKEDLTVSRAHFILEIRPPNCYVQDNMSTNGLLLLRQGEPPRRIQHEALQNGDRVRVGKDTILSFEIILPAQKTEVWNLEEATEAKIKPGEATPKPPVPQPVQATPPEPPRPQDVERFCVRCGAELTALPDLSKGSVRATDFMCSNCQRAVEEEQRRLEEARAADRYSCSQCGKDMTEMAKSDGRAAELQSVALYLCRSCAAKVLQRRSLGEWRLIKKLGAGGMGEVYQAWHPKTGRIAAVKVMLEPIRSEGALHRRFLREIAIMEKLTHPNIVRLYEAGEDKGKPFFVSEFVPGGDFAQFISKDGRPLLPPQEMVRLVAESLVGLHYLHQEGFVHRDLKVENLLLDNRDGGRTPKVADFGFARSYEQHGGTITRSGEFAGTWMYMPPEQITDFKRVRPTADIYAMGVTLYYLLSGQSPLPGFPAPWQIMSGQVVRLPRTPPQIILKDERLPLEKQNPNLPRRLCQVVNKAIAMKPEDRYQTAEEFRQALLESM